MTKILMYNSRIPFCEFVSVIWSISEEGELSYRRYTKHNSKIIKGKNVRWLGVRGQVGRGRVYIHESGHVTQVPPCLLSLLQ